MDGQPEVRSIGELRLLETLQLEINRRTTELEAARAKSGDFTAEQESELVELAAEQGKLAEIILNLIQKKSAEDDAPPAKAEDAEPKPPVKKPDGLDEELLKDLK